MMHWNAWFLSALGGLTLAAPAALENETDEIRGEREERVWVAELGQQAPGFELSDTDGKTWKLDALRGKTVVLEWFNPACPWVVSAHEEGPLESLGNDAAKREETVWLAINSGSPGTKGASRDENAAAREAWSMDYPVLLDATGKAGAAYRAATTPHMFVIDAAGKLVFAGHHDDIAAALDDVWADREVAKPRSKSEGCSVKYPREAELGYVAPDFEFPNIHGGDPIRLSDHRGRFVVLEWFNPQCPFVVNAHSEGGALHRSAANWAAEGVVWIAINSGAPGKQGTGAELNQSLAKEWGMDHPLLLDEEGKVGRAYGATNTPHMYVIDREGVLAYAGASDDQEGLNFVDQALGELLADKPVSKPRTKAYGCSVKYAQ